MSAVFEILPGIEVPVSGIAKSLARLWEGGADGGDTSEFRASQMNLVLHLGLPTEPADGAAQFQTALRFASRYPARILVLCPRPEGSADRSMRAKIYSECFIATGPGGRQGGKSCIEAVMLDYPQESRAQLEDQVSVTVETDLPVYYWVHRLSQVSRVADYRWLLGNSRRFILDSALCAPEAAAHPWPRSDGFRDLVHARLLPVRQSVGQFLSAYPPDAIAGGLKTVTVAARPEYSAEGNVLLDWARERLEACGASAPGRPAYETKTAEDDASLELHFTYANGGFFHWRANLAEGCAHFACDLGGCRRETPMTVGLLAPEAALSEAIFF